VDENDFSTRIVPAQKAFSRIYTPARSAGYPSSCQRQYRNISGYQILWRTRHDTQRLLRRDVLIHKLGRSLDHSRRLSKVGDPPVLRSLEFVPTASLCPTLGPTDAKAVAGAATEVAAPVVRPHHTRPAGLAGGSVHHQQHTEGPAREVHTGVRSSALRTESSAKRSRQGKAPRRNRRARSAIPCRLRGSSRPACWACAGQGRGRR
jgi:hypothetical protein